MSCLSWNWHDADWMVQRSRELSFPFMAGSSLVTCHRSPYLEHPLECPLEEAVAIGYSGLDIYGSHTLDILQCMVERRVGGESGVRAVTYMEGAAVWEAGAAGLFSMDLVRAAIATIDPPPQGRMEDKCAGPNLFLLEYNDGFKAAVLMMGGFVETLAYAARVDGVIHACEVRCGESTPHAGPGGNKGTADKSDLSVFWRCEHALLSPPQSMLSPTLN